MSAYIVKRRDRAQHTLDSAAPPRLYIDVLRARKRNRHEQRHCHVFSYWASALPDVALHNIMAKKDALRRARHEPGHSCKCIGGARSLRACAAISRAHVTTSELAVSVVNSAAASAAALLKFYSRLVKRSSGEHKAQASLSPEMSLRAPLTNPTRAVPCAFAATYGRRQAQSPSLR